MNNLNFTMVEGFLVKDPSITKVKDNVSLCKFTIGNSKSYTRRNGEKVRESAFFDITTWTKLADVCGKFLKKGSRVIVSGSMKVSSWKDTEGKPKSRIYVEGREVNFLPRSNSRGRDQSSSYSDFDSNNNTYEKSDHPQ